MIVLSSLPADLAHKSRDAFDDLWREGALRNLLHSVPQLTSGLIY
jgi:hypothetical protein